MKMSKASRRALALATVLAASMAVGTAGAADNWSPPKQKIMKMKTAKKPVYKDDPPPAPIPALMAPSWTGLYFGVSLGGRTADADWTTVGIVPPPVGTTPAGASMHRASLADMHLRLGGYVGYNWQMGPAVVGFEGDFGWADAGRSVAGIPGTFVGAASVADSASFDLKWDASLRARLGVLVAPAWMLYGTGGVAWQRYEFGASCTVAGGYCVTARSESADATRAGWTLGAGVETLLPGNWMARAEYRYADFRHSGTAFFAGTGDDVFVNVDVTTHTLLFGVAYKFGGAPVPVRARF
jgi:outer membrane immunogenic protein